MEWNTVPTIVDGVSSVSPPYENSSAQNYHHVDEDMGVEEELSESCSLKTALMTWVGFIYIYIHHVCLKVIEKSNTYIYFLALSLGMVCWWCVLVEDPFLLFFLFSVYVCAGRDKIIPKVRKEKEGGDFFFLEKKIHSGLEFDD